jgi:hypothetical protein
MTYFDSDDFPGNIHSNEHSIEDKARNYESAAREPGFHSEFPQKQLRRRLSKDQADFGKNRNDFYENSKYDMTHFGKNDLNTFPLEERSKSIMDKNHDQISSDRHLDRSYSQNQELDPILSEEFLQNLEKKRSSKHGGNGDEDSWRPIGIPLPNDVHQQLEHKQTRNLRNELPNSDESLDLDIEMKPLTTADGKYFDEDKSKLSSIPDKPNRDSEVTQKIEHVRTNIVSKSASKKTKVGVLVGGKLDQAKADIVQNNSPDPTYDKVKDFFKSQQVSSIVEAPLAEKKKAVKLYNIPHDENAEVKRSSIPKPSVHPDGIRLDLKERYGTHLYQGIVIFW